MFTVINNQEIISNFIGKSRPKNKVFLGDCFECSKGRFSFKIGYGLSHSQKGVNVNFIEFTKEQREMFAEKVENLYWEFERKEVSNAKQIQESKNPEAITQMSLNGNL